MNKLISAKTREFSLINSRVGEVRVFGEGGDLILGSLICESKSENLFLKKRGGGPGHPLRSAIDYHI